ncbi:hypothetical protein WN51_05959 [Melipona quadrifasciata]|uniref:Uncharacterized protein n=1 Tax=Melipona quadrifasciata TaxID=166423 RepID=A0A0N1ITY2_9HYME|nr:hypothetical protein WN51_05959 [Melipona quadrifasciata]
MVEYKQGFRKRALQFVQNKKGPILFKRFEQVATFFCLAVTQSNPTREDDAMERIQTRMIHTTFFDLSIFTLSTQVSRYVLMKVKKKYPTDDNDNNNPRI